jgi:hypothetical protein
MAVTFTAVPTEQKGQYLARPVTGEKKNAVTWRTAVDMFRLTGK